MALTRARRLAVVAGGWTVVVASVALLPFAAAPVVAGILAGLGIIVIGLLMEGKP